MLSLEYQDTKIAVVGPAAIVRFHWVGEAEAVADGKKSSTNLHILMNWQKQGADWKLLSRGIHQALTADRRFSEAVLPAVTPPSAARRPRDGSRRARPRARCETPGLRAG